MITKQSVKTFLENDAFKKLCEEYDVVAKFSSNFSPSRHSLTLYCQNTEKEDNQFQNKKTSVLEKLKMRFKHKHKHMMDIIKNQIEKIEGVVSDFKASDYFSLDYKETKKFSLTMLCALAGLYIAGLGTAKVIKLIKNELGKEDNK